jgi:hypothetical protein
MTDRAANNLSVVMRNPSPIRELRHNAEWSFDTRDGRSMKLIIVFDEWNRPHILSRSAA